MNDSKERLDTLLKREWHKKFRLYSVVIALSLIVISGIVAYSTGKIIDVTADVISLHSQASDSNEDYYLVVKLESGEVIKISAPRETGIRKGDSVNLKKRETNLFGFISYTLNIIGNQK